MIFFDLDGPLLDVAPKYYKVYADLVCEMGGSPLPKSVYWNRKRAKEDDTSILYDSGLATCQVSLYQSRRKKRIETEQYWKYDTVWPPVREAIEQAGLKGKIVLVTLRNNRSALLAQLRDLRIADWFLTVLSTSGDAAGPDRHDTKVRLVRGHYEMVPSGWFVGDTETDLRTGAALGLQRIAVAFGIRTEELLMLEKPELSFSTPQQLAAWIVSPGFHASPL